jgi:hypothetical protein
MVEFEEQGVERRGKEPIPERQQEFRPPEIL